MTRTLSVVVLLGACTLLVGCNPRSGETDVNAALGIVDDQQPGPTDADAPTEFSVTPDGIKYKVLRKSNRKRATALDTVIVHYKGWLDDGTEFDSSYANGQPAEFALGGTIAGWVKGLALVGEGGMIELEIPPDLGYGGAGSPSQGNKPGIPPNATLHFLIELLEVKSP